MELVPLADVRPERVSWLWPDRIPLAKLSIIDGDPGLGKSTVTIDLAARVSSGRVMPDAVVGDLHEPAGVVLLSAEDGLSDTIRPRLDAARADLSRVVALTSLTDEEGERLPTVADLPAIAHAIERVAAKLVVIDPLMAYLPGEVNSFRDQDVRRVLAPLARLAERSGAAVLVVRHLNKAAGGNPLYRGGGSIGIIGAVRAALLVAQDPEDDTGRRRVLASTKSNLSALPPSLVYYLEPAPSGTARVVWEGSSEHTAASLLAPPADPDEHGALFGAMEVLRDILANGAVPAKEAETEARAAGVKLRTLDRARAKLGVRAVRRGFGREGVWLWELPAHRAPPGP